ncbi:MAG: hypothetical protein R2752_14820 [Vicinamibacterales bacterium]
MPARRWLVTTMAAAALGAAVTAAPPVQVDVTRLGPQVGDRVADFQLVDAAGRPQSIRSAAGPKGTMLVFFRSADW